LQIVIQDTPTYRGVHVFFSDAARDKILNLAEKLQIDGFISRVNPDTYPGVTNSKFDELLLELSERGIAAMPHPTLMRVSSQASHQTAFARPSGSMA
jgi:hypothetical protein